MQDLAIMFDWVGFAVRWLHVITAMAWIGASFYFIALDLMLKPNADLPEGAYGEEWEVHGGGFYHTVKYLVAPKQMPEHLTWHKWQSYSTWLSGAALLMIIYWAGAELYLIDLNKLELTTFTAILISAGSLTIGWLIYDFLCKSSLAERPTSLMLLLFVLLIAMAWGYNQIFTGRAALLHLGAFTATIMTANVFFIIMPNQRIVVDDLKNGRTPDAKYGKIAKLRSTHNNYLTLPVIFLMLSNHYPLAFATDYNWLITTLVFLLGVTIRHYFNTMHAGKGNLRWTWLISALIFLAIMWLSTAPLRYDTFEEAQDRPLTAVEQVFAAADGWEDVESIIIGRCSMCHAREPFWDGIHRAPKGLLLETGPDVLRAARQVYLQAGVTDAMPPANITFMEDDERRAVARWYRSGAEQLPFNLAMN